MCLYDIFFGRGQNKRLQLWQVLKVLTTMRATICRCDPAYVAGIKGVYNGESINAYADILHIQQVLYIFTTSNPPQLDTGGPAIIAGII